MDKRGKVPQRHGNANSIGRLIARELRAPLKKSCPECDGWRLGLTKTDCKRCKGVGFI